MAAITAKLGQDQFMQLLIAQLKNQDPMDPVSQEDSIAQLAQFSTLEGIEKLNANFASFMKLSQLTEGAGLVGKNVEWLDADGVRQQGVVESVSVDGGDLQVEIDGAKISIDNVTAVLDG